MLCDAWIKIFRIDPVALSVDRRSYGSPTGKPVAAHKTGRQDGGGWCLGYRPDNFPPGDDVTEAQTQPS